MRHCYLHIFPIYLWMTICGWPPRKTVHLLKRSVMKLIFRCFHNCFIVCETSMKTSGSRKRPNLVSRKVFPAKYRNGVSDNLAVCDGEIDCRPSGGFSINAWFELVMC
ncbi:hypothetical protein CDAR_495891 [Caerostris darwini]|uniref:Secreted protein n=1 Tax=Caerostris darwini TaxID=1538125 RepID=A0AAV4VWB9_9ARAC|nr:hypothetical protein CDAR_495891 [Caerostris darwini]